MTTTARIMYDDVWPTALRVAGGADEVRRNQIAEPVLGTPGVMRTDRTVPFNKL
jgi:acyl-CoA dehydrogenase